MSMLEKTNMQIPLTSDDTFNYGCEKSLPQMLNVWYNLPLIYLHVPWKIAKCR